MFVTVARGIRLALFQVRELWATETLTSYTSHTQSTRVSTALIPPRQDTRRKDIFVAAEHSLFYSS